MIVEGIVTTRCDGNVVNVAPMGPMVDERQVVWQQMVLRPYQTSRTFANLLSTGEGVFHVTDDVLLLAEATVGVANPETVACTQVRTPRLLDCCRYYEFHVGSIDDSEPRSRIDVTVVHEARVRDYFGLNRAKHAIVEASILISRIDMLARATIESKFEELSVLVEKTGGVAEHKALALLRERLHHTSRHESHGGTA